MPLYIDPNTLEGQQLVLHAIGSEEYSVQVADHIGGGIIAKPMSGGGVVWFWTITGPYLPIDMRPSHGEADTLLQAKAAFRAKYDRWLAWARDLGRPVDWTSWPHATLYIPRTDYQGN
jgi:hypothetical protein